MDPGSGGGGGGGGGSSSGSSSSDSAPDCWDQADMEAPGPGPCGGGGPLAAGAEAQREHLSAAFSRQLNVNAKPFVPNVHAAEFVPSFLRGPAQPPPAPAGAASHLGAGGPSGKGPGPAGWAGWRAARGGRTWGADSGARRGGGDRRGGAAVGLKWEPSGTERAAAVSATRPGSEDGRGPGSGRWALRAPGVGEDSGSSRPPAWAGTSAALRRAREPVAPSPVPAAPAVLHGSQDALQPEVARERPAAARDLHPCVGSRRSSPTCAPSLKRAWDFPPLSVTRLGFSLL